MYKYKNNLYPDIRTLAKVQCVNYKKLKDLIWDKVPIDDAVEKLKELKTVKSLSKTKNILSKLTKDQVEMLEKERHFEYIKFRYNLSQQNRYSFELVKAKNLVEVIDVRSTQLIQLFINALNRGVSVQDCYEKMKYSFLKNMRDDSPSYTRNISNSRKLLRRYMLQISLDYPPSVNHYWIHGTKNGRAIVYIGAKGRIYRELSYWKIKEATKELEQ